MGNISKITLPDNTSWGIRAGYIPFGKVDSTSTSTAFTATVDGITALVDGACCYLMNGVVTSASGWTLNVNGLGAKHVYQTLAAAGETTTIFNINYTMLFVYNSQRVSGGCWDVFYGYNSNTTYSNASLGQGYGTCSTAEATVAKTVSLSSYSLTTGGIVAVKFTHAVPANATLNINSKGAKAIYYRGEKITAGIIKAGDIAYFIYSTYYHLLGVDRGASVPSAGNTVTDVTYTTSAVGSSSDYSRSDHQHAISSSTITSALGYTPYNSTNPNGYIGGLEITLTKTSGNAVTANATFTDFYNALNAGKRVRFYALFNNNGIGEEWTMGGFIPGTHDVYLSRILLNFPDSYASPVFNYIILHAEDTDDVLTGTLYTDMGIPYTTSQLTNDSGFITLDNFDTKLFFFTQVSGSTTDYNLREALIDPMPDPVTFSQLVCTLPELMNGYLLDKENVKVYFVQMSSQVNGVFWNLYDVNFATKTITLSRFDETTHSMRYASFTSALDGNNEELPLVGSVTTQALLTTETDPTVPSWAKSSTKPSYGASEIGYQGSQLGYLEPANNVNDALDILDTTLRGFSDTKVTNTLATTTKYYVTGTTMSTTNTGTQSFDTGIYATSTAGQLNATTYKVNEQVTLQWNSTDSCLDFIFT